MTIPRVAFLLPLVAAALFGQVLLNEDFNDGLADGWQTFNPGWQVVGGVYQGTNTTPNIPVETYYAPGNVIPGWTDYVAQAQFAFQGGYEPSDAQLLVRYNSPNNGAGCQIVKYNGVFRMYLFASGNQLVQPLVVPLTVGVPYTLKATVLGSHVTCEIVGLPGATVNASSALIPSTGTVGLRATHVPVFFDDVLVIALPVNAAAGAGSFLIRYASNLTSGDSSISLTNDGSNGASLNGPGFGAAAGNICVNVYAFSPDEQLVSCCSCLITPNGLVSLSINSDLVSNTLTGVRPNSVVIKLVNTGAGGSFSGGTCTNSAASAGSAAFPIAHGLIAWGTTLHSLSAPLATAMSETPFSDATLSSAELASITSRCASIIGNGSTFGICRSCRAGGLGASAR